jgi:hypothetical protein
VTTPSAPVGFVPMYGPLPPLAHRPERDARETDAHVDRVVLVPTAETHPAGTVYFSSYDIVGLQIGYALGDRTQLTLSFVPPLSREPVVPFDLSVKHVLTRSRRVRVAAIGSATGIFGVDADEAVLGRVGGVVELCFDDACRSNVSTSGNLVLAGSALVLANGMGAVLRATDLFAVLVELQSVVPLESRFGQINALGAALGMRFSGRVWAVDVAVEAPLDRRTNPRFVPLLVVSRRFF